MTLSSITVKLEKFIGLASRWANFISLWFLLIMPLPVFIDVIARLAFKGSIPGGIEIESYILLIIVFLGIAFIQFNEGHIRIGFIVSRFPEWIRNLLDCFHLHIVF
jgi:TRAP-type C4-dicarboxylate transport system permease small subunit